MKVEIMNDDPSGCSGNSIYVNDKRLQNVNSLGFRQYEFSEDEIHYILGEREFKAYEKGKYVFNIAAWKLDIISGKGLKNADSIKNRWSYNYQLLKK